MGVKLILLAKEINLLFNHFPHVQVPKPFVAARALSSKVNGIVAAPKLAAFQKQQQQVVASVGLDIQCADGRRGGKLKTRKSAAKRFKVTGSGRVVVRHAGKNHFQEKKSSKRRAKLSMMHLAPEAHTANIKGCLPYAKLQ